MSSRSETDAKRRTVAHAAYGGIIIALALALGYALAVVPNIELVTLTLAFGGILLGKSWGAAIGAMGFGLYSALSPYGIAPPPLLVAQIVGGAIIGFGGGLMPTFLKKRKAVEKAIFCGIFGFASTAIYDVITNIGGFFAISTGAAFVPYIIGGIAFGAVHILSNTAIFAAAMPLLYARFTRRETSSR